MSTIHNKIQALFDTYAEGVVVDFGNYEKEDNFYYYPLLNVSNTKDLQNLNNIFKTYGNSNSIYVASIVYIPSEKKICLKLKFNK